MRFYELTKDGGVKFRKSIATIPQARKAKGVVVASVTSKLSFYPNEWMKSWREEQLIELARKHPDASFEVLSDLAWGTATCPKTGQEILSSDFGTNVHKSIEERLEAISPIYSDILVPSYTPDSAYSPYSDSFIRYVEENELGILRTEHAIGCPKLLLAATADFIACRDGMVELYDFKCRGGKSPLAQRAYPKDCHQLAATALMVKEQWDLGYMPRIYTVPIDRGTGETYVKRWTESMQERRLQEFLKFNEWFNTAEPVT